MKRLLLILMLIVIPSICFSQTSYKSLIGKEDIRLQTNANTPAETFERQTSTGGVVTLTRFPDIWGGTGLVNIGKLKFNNTNLVMKGTAAPTTGTFVQGDIVWNTGAATNGIPFWYCTSGGTPGIWQAGPLLGLTSSGGGVGTPGGSPNSLQWNNAGVFGGIDPVLNKLLVGTTGPVWGLSSYTIPSTATNLKVWFGNGTNIVESTPAYPNATPESGRFIQGNGTDYIKSTFNVPTVPGSSGCIWQSDGSNISCSNSLSFSEIDVPVSAGDPGTNPGNIKINSTTHLLKIYDDQSTVRLIPFAGTLTNLKWCSSDGTVINCTENAPGGTVYPGVGVAISTGAAWDTSKTAPTGDIVGTSDSQALTNKDMSGAGNTWPTFNQSTSGSSASVKSPANTGLVRFTGMGVGTTRDKTVVDADATIAEVGQTQIYDVDSIPIAFAVDGATAPGSNAVLTSTNKAKYRDFSGSADNDVFFEWQVPYGIDTSVSPTFQVEGWVTNATAPANTETIKFLLKCASVGHSDLLSSALPAGTTVTFTADATLAQYDRVITGYSGALTITNLAAGEIAVCNLSRDTTDTYGQAFGVGWIKIKYAKKLQGS